MPSSHSQRRRTRAMSDINVVPYIDVMLVLLVIFMVTAPLAPPSSIDLARAGGAGATPDAYVEVIVERNGSIAVKRSDAREAQQRNLDRKNVTAAVLRARGKEALPVVITADRNVPYGEVASLLGQLKEQVRDGAALARVGLMVRPEK